MSPLLTVAIPTFNRAALLDTQLAWLSDELSEAGSAACEVIISDNCSTDDTGTVIARWQERLGANPKRHRQASNIGAVRNIAWCMNAASGKYVWTISDDDAIKRGTLSYLLSQLSQAPDLALVILNFSGRNAVTGNIQFERRFHVEDDSIAQDGKAAYERCLEQHFGGVSLTTALVYRTELARRALREWPEGLDNLAVQMYWTAFCALHGPVKVTRELFLECATGRHFFSNDPKLFLRLFHADVPALYVKLKELGFSPGLCRKMLRRQLRWFRRRRFLQCAWASPSTAVAVTYRYLACAWLLYVGQPRFPMGQRRQPS